MIRKRTIFMLIIIAITIIVQLFGIPYLGFKSTSYDIEFDFIYNWDLRGTGGWYSGYSETYRSTGTYKIQFGGVTANVIGTVSWTWSESEYGISDSNDELYTFTYSLINGAYVSGSDQDYDTTGMNVWFHIPGGITASSYDLLDTSYDVTGYSTIWVGFLMPFIGKQLHSEGEYLRDDIYGQFTAAFQVDNYFSSEGFLLGEHYHEYDEGYDADTGYWSEFTLDSVLFVTSSSYVRTFNIGMYLLAYWFPIFCFYLLLYVVYERLRWRPRVIPRETKERDIIIERNLPRDVSFSIKSAYSEIIPSFLVRGRSQNKRIISAHNQTELKGIGYIEPNEKLGSFYGTYSSDMIKYAKVKYAFTELTGFPGFRTIEIYDILQIENLQEKNFTFDTLHIKPITPRYLPGIMRMVANEDVGKSHPRYAKWVEDSYKDDIGMVAIATERDKWVQPIVTEILTRKYPKPEMLRDEVIMGVGFATPGETTGWLYGLYVHPAFRNRGIGRMLVMSRLSALKEMGVGTAITEIAEWNSPAKNIYDDLNAINVGKIKLLGKKMPKVKVRRN